MIVVMLILLAGFLHSLSLSISTLSPVPELERKAVSLHGLSAFSDIQTRDSSLEFIEFLLKPGLVIASSALESSLLPVSWPTLRTLSGSGS